MEELGNPRRSVDTYWSSVSTTKWAGAQKSSGPRRWGGPGAGASTGWQPCRCPCLGDPQWPMRTGKRGTKPPGTGLLNLRKRTAKEWLLLPISSQQPKKQCDLSSRVNKNTPDGRSPDGLTCRPWWQVADPLFNSC